MEKDILRKGDKVYRWWDSGISMDIQPLTVVRVNKVTVTVQTGQGNQFRINPNELVGFYPETD